MSTPARIATAIGVVVTSMLIVTFDGVTTIGGIYFLGVATGAAAMMSLSHRAF